MSKVICVDLGTGNSAMAFLEGGEPKIIPNAEGGRTTPSIVAWSKNGERIVGQAAKRQAVTNPKNTVYEIKRFIGRKFAEVQNDIKLVSYEVVEGPNGDCRVKIGDKQYSPEEISSFILAKLKKDAEAYLGEEVKEAVITVPAYFNDSQRQATKDAGTIAGLNVLRILNEPTAAALAYGSDKKKSGYIAVADSGSGTLDFSILEIGDGVFEVKSTSGDSQLGGKDYDQSIMKWLVEEFKAETGIDLSNDNMAIQRLKDEAEKAKIALSTTESIEINLPFITADATGPKHLIKTLSRAKLEVLVAPLNDRYDAPAKQCIKDSGVDKIDEVILVGGTTRMPSVQRKIADIFGMEPSKNVNPDEVVACGAAIQAGIIKGEVKDVLLLDVTPLSLSICTNGRMATHMIEKNTTIPCKKTNVFTTAADYQPAVTIQICQGERPIFSDNKQLGTFNLDGIPPAPRGVPQIEVTFDIDANGILTVSAKDLGTQKEQKITITSSSGLSKDEIDKAIKEAEQHAEKDKKRAETEAAKNSAESLCYNIEKSLADNKDKIPEDVNSKVKAAVEKTREAIKTDDLAKIKEAVAAMSKENEAVAKILYPNASTMPDGKSFSEEDLKKMMSDPKFAQMFGGVGGFQNPFNNMQDGTTKPGSSNDDSPIDAEVVS